MSLRSFDELGAEARVVLERYLETLETGLCEVEPGLAEETLDSVRAHALEVLGPESTESDVDSMISDLGGSDELAAELCHAVQADESRPSGTGSFLGIPYEFRAPTGERAASRWWNPRDPRLFVPKVFGVGWTLNFGAAAVKLHLIEPDAEEEPFAHASDRAFLAALLVPVGLTAALLGGYLALRAELPPELPIHWDWAGRPDNFAPSFLAFFYLLVAALVPSVLALWSLVARRSALTRGALLGFATLMSSLAAVIWVLTVLAGLGARIEGWVFPVAIFGSLAVPLVVLTALARSGRATEIERDLGERR